MIVEVDGQEFDTDKIVIKHAGSIVEITEGSCCLETLVFLEGDSPSDGVNETILVETPK